MVGKVIVEQKKEVASEVIKVTPSSKAMLEKLKLIDDESYSSVISRLLQTNFEELLELNLETKEMLDSRMKKIAQGKVLPFEEMMARRKG